MRCKQVVFPAGFHIDANNNVYTPEISPLYRLATKKKDTEVSENSHLVRLVDSRWNQIEASIILVYEKLTKLGFNEEVQIK